jgi:hypothetical protein
LTQINILWFLVPLYVIAIVMMKPSTKLFVGLAFDSGGVSGGALTSAFLTPLTLGIAQAVSNTVASAGGTPQSILTNGFGIIAFISVTPLIAVQTLGLIYESKYKKAQKLDEAQEVVKDERLLFSVIIVGRDKKDDVLTALHTAGVHVINALYGHGTVKAGYLENMLGLVPEQNKVVITTIAEFDESHAMLEMLRADFDFDNPNTGIAFTIPVDEMSF